MKVNLFNWINIIFTASQTLDTSRIKTFPEFSTSRTLNTLIENCVPANGFLQKQGVKMVGKRMFTPSISRTKRSASTFTCRSSWFPGRAVGSVVTRLRGYVRMVPFSEISASITWPAATWWRARVRDAGLLRKAGGARVGPNRADPNRRPRCYRYFPFFPVSVVFHVIVDGVA